MNVITGVTNGNTHVSLTNVQENVLVTTVNGVSVKMNVIHMKIVSIKLLHGMMNMLVSITLITGVLKTVHVKMMKRMKTSGLLLVVTTVLH